MAHKKYLCILIFCVFNISAQAQPVGFKGIAHKAFTDIKNLTLYRTPYDRKKGIEAYAKIIDGKFHIQEKFICEMNLSPTNCLSWFEIDAYVYCDAFWWLPYFETEGVAGENWYGLKIMDGTRNNRLRKENEKTPILWASEKELPDTRSLYQMLETTSPNLVTTNKILDAVDFYDTPGSVPIKIMSEGEYMCDPSGEDKVGTYKLIKFAMYKSEEYAKVGFNSSICSGYPVNIVNHIQGEKFIKLYNKKGKINLWWDMNCAGH